MAEGEVLKRIDAHMDRGNELMTRGNQLMAEVREEMRLTREEVERSRQAHADLRAFIREQTVRAERVTDRQVRALDGLILRQDEGITALRDLRADVADLRDDSRARTQALLAVIDRLS